MIKAVVLYYERCFCSDAIKNVFVLNKYSQMLILKKENIRIEVKN